MLVVIAVAALLWVFLLNPMLTRALTRNLLMNLAVTYASDVTIVIGGIIDSSEPPEYVAAAKRTADEILEADKAVFPTEAAGDSDEVRDGLRRDAIALAMARNNWLADAKHSMVFRQGNPGRYFVYVLLVLLWWLGLLAIVGSSVWLVACLL